MVARARVRFSGLLALAMVLLALFCNLDYLKTPNASLFIKENLVSLLMVPPITAALIWPKRWVQWVAGLGLMVCVLLYLILFCSTLG